MSTKTRSGAALVYKVSNILTSIAAASPHGIRLSELTSMLGYDDSTTYRLLSALTDTGLLRKTPTKTYLLGPSIFHFSLAADYISDLHALFEPLLCNITKYSQDTAYLMRRQGDDVVCINRMAGSFPVKVLSLDIHDTRPLGSNASGISILSTLPAIELESILNRNAPRYAQYPRLTLLQIRHAIERCQRDGYAVVHLSTGTTSIGIPIRGPSGATIAALALASISTRMPSHRIIELASFLRREVDTLEHVIQKRISSFPETVASN